MVELIEIVFLAIVQGLTEWFPISSSGHLVLVQEGLGIKVPVAFDVVLHIGTLLSVGLFMRRDIILMIKSLLGFNSIEERRLSVYVVVGSLPIVAVGLTFKDLIERAFSDAIAVAIALLVNGFILFLTKYSTTKGNLSLSNTLTIGVAQVLSVFPGVSRSGSTISTAILRGVDRQQAYRFSFLLSIVAILGASVLEVSELDLTEISFEMVLIGFLVSALVGYASIRKVSKLVLKGDFYKFSFYCWFLGFLVLIIYHI
ncbi:MAG: undecaprenyl-diphosphate phosphatase [Nitrososphaeria archaeon]